MRPKCSRIHKGFAALFDTSDEKSDGAIPRFELCGICPGHITGCLFQSHFYINPNCSRENCLEKIFLDDALVPAYTHNSAVDSENAGQYACPIQYTIAQHPLVLLQQ